MTSHLPSPIASARAGQGSPAVPAGFLDAWQQLLNGAPAPLVPRRRGRRPRVPVAQLLPALTFHVMQHAGTLATHFGQLFDAPLADSSWSDRRTRLPWAIFADLMRRGLRPRATRRQHPDAFWRGYRLVALDGTHFSVTKPPQVRRTVRKARTRRGRAAFAKLASVVWLEVGLHNPLAAAIGRPGQSEWALAQEVVAQVPARALVLADRLYGCGAFVLPLLTACARVGSQCLLRVKVGLQAQPGPRLRDGSRLVTVGPWDRAHRQRVDTVTVREIRVRVGRPGHRTHVLRLWTSLLDAQRAPALELAQVYARRWEHELYYRELKRQLRKTHVLQSHTVETAAQEIAALILASALLAVERARAAPAGISPLRVSFPWVLEIVKAMWFTVLVGEHVLTDAQTHQILARAYAVMGACVTPARRARSCPRAVRQPTLKWPRLLRPTSITGPVRMTMV
jgi:hypothetical protein